MNNETKGKIFRFCVSCIIIFLILGSLPYPSFHGYIEKTKVIQDKEIHYGIWEDDYYLVFDRWAGDGKYVSYDVYFEHDIGDIYTYNVLNTSIRQPIIKQILKDHHL